MGIVTAKDMEGLVPLAAEEKARLGFKPEQAVFKDQKGKVIEFEVAKVLSSIPVKRLYDDKEYDDLAQTEKDKIDEIMSSPLLEKMIEKQLEDLGRLCISIIKTRTSRRDIVCAKKLKIGDRVMFSRPNDKHIGGKIGVVKEIKKNHKVVVNYGDNKGYMIPASMLLLVDPDYKGQ